MVYLIAKNIKAETPDCKKDAYRARMGNNSAFNDDP